MTKLVPFCRFASKPPANLMSPTKYASCDFLHDFFHQLVGLEFGVGLEIEDQNVLAAEALATRIHKLARPQEYLNPRLILLVALPLFLGLFFFGFLFGLALLQLLDPFLRLLVFLFLFRFA